MTRHSDEFGHRLRGLREERGLSQAEAAQQMGVSQQYWSQWERGTVPARDVFEKLLGTFRLIRREWLEMAGYKDYLDVDWIRFTETDDEEDERDREFTLTLHQLQRESGFSDEQVAKAADLPVRSWKELRSGWFPSGAMIPHLADALNAPAEARYVMMAASGLSPGQMGLTEVQAAGMPITLGEVLRAVQLLATRVEELHVKVDALGKDELQ